MTNTSKLIARLAFAPTSLLFFVAMITLLSVGKLSAQVVITPTKTDALCAGSCDGAIDLKVSGGTTPYTYAWASSVAGTGYQTINLCQAAAPTNCANYTITDIAVKLCPGTYTVTVTDNAGLTKTSVNTVAIQPSNKLQVVTDPSTTTCVAGCTGIIKVNPSGGNAPYTYSWSGSAVTGNVRNALCGGVSPVGDYTVKVTDAAGCDTVLTYHIGPTPSPTITGAPICAGASATLTASGGGTYTWSANAGSVNTVTATVNPVANTTYTVTVSNAGCPDATATYALVVNPAVTASVTPTNIVCNGKNTGSIVVSPTTGTSPYTYAWTGSGPNSPTNSNLVAGGYTVTIFDSKGCTTTKTATLTEPTPIVITPTTVKPACNGSTGSATVSGSGGTSPYSYVWSNAATGATISGVPADSYTVTVTDNSGCTQTAVIPISNNPSPTISSITGTPPLCNGNANGTTTVVATGGTGTLTYNWSSGSTTTGATGLTGSTYVVTVTDANNCKEISTVTITDPPILTTTASAVDANCGNADGSVSASPTGGTGAYTYLWASGGATGQTATLLTAATYTVTVTDKNGCTATSTATIGTQTTGTPSVAKTDLNCNGDLSGTVTATLTGGTAATYTWSSGGTGNTKTGLAAGSYTVTITDSNGCTSTSSATVTEPTLVTASATSTTAICTAANGTATVTPGGGTTPYQYLWSNSSLIAAPTGLTAATYTVTVTDFKGCTATSTVAVGAVNGSGVATASVVNNVLCFGESTGILTVTMAAGTSPFTYNWAPLGGTGQTTVGLNARNYTVTVTDANGCQVTSSATLTDPAVLTAFTTPTDATCGQANGSATVTANGGTGTLTYAWPTPGNETGTSATSLSANSYIITITDANSCTKTTTAIINNAGGGTATTSVNNDVTCFGGTNGSATVSMAGGAPAYTYTWAHGPTTTTVSNLAKGTYTVTVKDANGCESVSTVDITEPIEIVPVTSHTNAPCGSLTGSVSVTSTTGGTGIYTYTWSPGGGNSSIMTDIGFGTYTVTITDASGCTKTTEESVSNVPGPTVTLTGTNLSCNGASNGTVTVVANGGTGILTYVWSTATATGATSVTGLGAGSYNVSVTDAGGCTGVSNVTITQPAPIKSTFSSTDATCGSSNGSLTVTPSGGAAPYTYVWFDSSTGQTASSLTSGGYAVTITDANGCTLDTSGTVNPAGGGVASITLGSNVSCYGKKDGSATASVAGGTPAYTYTWSHGPTTTTVSNLAGGTYSVTVTDANGCSSVSTILITEPAEIIATTTVTGANCGVADGSATVTVTGVVGPPIVIWSDDPTYQTTTTATNLVAGSYTVMVTDQGTGCTVTATAVVDDSPSPTITSVTATDVKCNGGSDGSAVVVANGGTGTLTYTWTNGTTSGTNLTTATGLVAGVYYVTVTDATGCKKIGSTTVLEPAPIALTTSSTPATCGSSNGSATVSAGTGTFTYLWDANALGQNTDTATNLAANDYVVTVTDNNGCTATTTVNVSNNGAGTTTATWISDVTCFGKNDGSASATLVGGGGSPTYLWSNPSASKTQTVTNLAAGTYFVTITDANGCQSNSSVVISEPPAITNEQTKADATCGLSNGSVGVINVAGGDGFFSYKWDDNSTGSSRIGLIAGSYSVTITDGNSCTKTDVISINNIPGPSINTSKNDLTCNGDKSGSATVSFTGNLKVKWSSGVKDTNATVTDLAAGTYIVTVSDANNCSAVSTVVISEPTPVVASTTTLPATCGQSNGRATVNASGGISPLTHVWTNGSTTYTGTVYNNLPIGTYTVVVSDDNGCTTSSTATINNSDGPKVTGITSTNILCNGLSTGTATVTLTTGAGTSPYTYSWSNGISDVTSGLTNTISSLVADTFSVTVKDANGCQVVTDVIVTEPAALGVPTFSTSNAACGKNNGSATASSTGGTPPLNFKWNDGNATIGATASNLPTGTYIVTVTDANSCSKTASVNIGTSNGPKAVLAGTNMLCNTGNTGTATVTVTSGTAPLTYSWSTGVTATTSINNLYADTIYKVTVTDSKGCSSTSTVVLGKPAALVVTTTPTNAICGTDNGTVIAKVTNGSVPYTYSWSNSKNSSTSFTSDTILMVAAGAYTVLVTDSKGCTASSDTVVKSKSKTVLTVIPAQQTINEGGTVSIVVVGAVTYTWSPAEGLTCTDCPNPTASPTVTTTYTIVATDLYGCTAVAFMTVTVRKDCSASEADIFIANVFSPNDDGMNDKLYIQGNGLSDIYWAIYDRWGNLLYEAFDQLHPWDGTRRGRPMDVGTYVYYLKATCVKTGDKVVLKGNVSIVQ